MVSERELIQRTRESGKEFLRKNPGAFGGGIDPSTGTRSKGGKSTKTTPSSITEVSPGVFRVRDPTTGKLVVTSSLEFAQSIGEVGKSEATAISKAESGGRRGRAKIRQAEELERRGEFEKAERIRSEVEGFDKGERTPQQIQALAEEEARQESVKLGERVTPIEPTGEPREAGALTLTQEEFEQAGEQAPTGRGVLVVGEDVSPADAVGIGAEVDTIRSSSERGFIETGLEPGFRVGLSEQERDQGTGEVILGRSAEVGGKIVAIGGSLIEGAVNFAGAFGVQKLEFDESGEIKRPEGFRFSETGIVGRARAKPKGTGALLGSALVIAPLVGGAVAGGISAVSQLGFKGALVETAGSFTPLKIKPGTFGALSGGADDLKFDVVSLKSQKGDFTQRLVVGRAEDFDDVLLVSRQVSKDGLGVATTDIVAPQTTFRAGKFTEGIAGGRVDTLFFGKAGTPSVVSRGALTATQTFDDIVGAGAGVISRQRFGFTFDPRSGLDIALGGDVSKQIVGGVTARGEAFDIVGAGKGRPFLKIGREGITRSVRVQDFNVRGLEFDASKFSGDATSQVGTRIVGGGAKTPFSITSQQEAFTQVSAGVSGFKPFVATPTTPSAAPVVSTVFGTPSVFAGTGQFERTDLVGVRPEVGGSMMDSLLQQPQADVLPIVDTSTLVGLDVKPRQRERTRVISRARQEFDFGRALDFKPEVALDVKTQQRLRQPVPQKQIAVTTTVSPLAFDFGFKPEPFVTPFSLPPPIIPTFAFRDRPGAVVTGDRGFQRTPSLGAVLKFELGLEQPKFGRGLEETGLVERAFTSKQLIAPLGSI